MKSVLKMTLRSVRTFFGRWMALLLIVALSAGFFAGLKLTTDAMVNTGNLFFTEQNLYDFRLFSTLGFTEDDLAAFEDLDGVGAAEGMYSADVLVGIDGSDRPVKLMSRPEEINLPSLSAGRMPENETECLADDHIFKEDDLGTTLTVSDTNDEDRLNQITETEYTIVGLVDSPLYISLDRGTTDIGAGALYAFLYVEPSVFSMEVYTEIDVSLADSAEYAIYSDGYKDLADAHEDAVTELLDERAGIRYDDILSENVIPEEYAEQYGITPAETYCLTRRENAGYVSFENDTSIIGGVADIFPVFFIAIAMLVCATTMTRMVDEERTQIGTLKSLGFGNSGILAKYLIYAGSAAVLGWVLGFFVCTWGLPQVFWNAYSVLYDFSAMPYLFDGTLAVLTLCVSLAFILGSTAVSCRRALSSVPAALIRPRASKGGRRILLERITPLWRPLPFLRKITLRNMFRYKTRLVMMLIGIGCCAGLVLTAFGVGDSMGHIAEIQFEEIQTYALEVSYDAGNEEAARTVLGETDGVSDWLPVLSGRVEVHSEDTMMSSVTLYCVPDDNIDDLGSFFTLEQGEDALPYPADGEVLVSKRLGEKLALDSTSDVRIKSSDDTAQLRVSGVFDNYINNAVFITESTYEEYFGSPETNTALVRITGDEETVAEALVSADEITGVSRLSTLRNNVDNALGCLDYIITLIVVFSGALAFIVTFNLTNINLAEQSREIATVEVLGFYPRETQSYVLSENLILSVAASVLGLPLGYAFHNIVMHRILIDSFTFDIHIAPASYLGAFVCSVCFAFIVNLFMRKRIDAIPMAESLKAVE